MKADRWQVVKAVLDEVLEAEEGGRESLLAERCAGDPDLRREVEALLAADERATDFLRTVTPPAPGALPQGEEIGPYRIVRLIGEGGMGEVYEAEQAKPVRRRVALKFVKLGMDTRQVVARFDTERQALALMSHPNIARVFDVGTTDKGRPYFVMEYVPGVPVSEYCDTQHLDARERLALFIQICEGVHHAHQKGIIHRDIKPSNVLVTLVDGKPVPKIIDFGVAKATAQRLTEATFFTQLGQAIGTPEYMSPEQMEVTGIDVDIRTDVYALGVLLYELLTGARPFNFRAEALGFDEMRRRVREQEPTRPSTRARELSATDPVVAKNRRTDPKSLVSNLRGDLDWITLKALEKDRARRYASVPELVADIERYLNDQPVLAGPASRSYRMGKFVRRHKVGVGATALVMLALVLGAAAATVGLVRAQRAEAQARQEAETARQVSDFLVKIFQVSDPGEARGNTVTAREILDRGAERIREELKDQPLVQAKLMNAIALVYVNLGLLEQAESLHRNALETRVAVLGERSLDVAQMAVNLGVVDFQLGRYDEAENLMRRSLVIRTELLGEDALDVAESRAGLGMVVSDRGRLEEAVRLYEQALPVYEKKLPPDDPQTADIVSDLGTVYHMQGDFRKAEAFYRRALAMGERVLGPDHFKVGLRLTSLGIVSKDLGRYEEAESFLLRSLQILKKVNGEDHPNVANTLHELGVLYSVQGRYREAEPLFERALATLKATLGEGHPLVADTLLALAELRRDQGRPAEAETFYRQALAVLEGAVGADNPGLVRTRKSYAAFLRAQGREKEAAAIETRANESRPSS
jgi:serine/threonine protein kinase/tetratricopeptide (TPR) repeat protein